MVSKEKQLELQRSMQENGVSESDLIEKFITSSGSGGQKVNKTASSVYLKHVPTQIAVKYHKDRLREVNRFFARRLLLEKILQHQTGSNATTRKQAKMRKQKDRRKRRQQKKISSTTKPSS